MQLRHTHTDSESSDSVKDFDSKLGTVKLLDYRPQKVILRFARAQHSNKDITAEVAKYSLIVTSLPVADHVTDKIISLVPLLPK